ncbi:MAG: hydrogenase small subunit [Deltaproteobacteria bacterium]|jgi:[NiFe] hydrogenase small subunit|nr:hydrogenase small subunit [Deltaproteobacteria bacterium]
MRFSIGLGKTDALERLEQRGVSRREFLKFCSAVAVVMGLGPGAAESVAAALTGKRPAVVYLHGSECTGCSESVMRVYDPFIDELILDTISLDYHETIMAAAGHAAEEALHKAVSSPEGYVCVIEGAVPTARNGLYGTVGGKTMLKLCSEIAPKAKAVFAYGTCAAYGGIPAAKPNPTGAKGVGDALAGLKGKEVKPINLPGCPPNPVNFVAALVHWLQNKSVPELDEQGRPLMFYGTPVHEQCERLPHFEQGEFAPSFESEEAKKGWCLYELGCKGPNTYNNCPKIKFNQTNWPVQAGHPCIGCSEPNFWDEMTPFYES